MKWGLLFFICFYSFQVFATNSQIFRLFRTNYYTDKTMVYVLDFDESSCRITKNNPIDVFFISTQSGAKLNEFSSYNKKYFSAQNILSPSPQNLKFSFNALSELQSITGKKFQLEVKLSENNSRCLPQTLFLVNQKPVVEDLRRVDVKFKLALGQPNGIEWLKLIGRSKQVCLIGSCQ